MRPTITMKTKQQSKHWSNYWQGGQLTSLPYDFKNNYNGTIYNQWITSFQSLNKNNSILDLCTGNCAIALLASQYSKDYNKEFSIHAVDAADINKNTIEGFNPNQKEYLKKINLTPNCKIEEIGLPHNHYDLITSQYGIEYTNWKNSATKIKQLLKPNGEFTMICHSSSSQIIETMEQEQNDYLTAINHGLFRNFDYFANNKLSYRKFIHSLKRIQQTFNKKFRQSPSELLRSLLLLNDDILNTNKTNVCQNLLELKRLSQQHKNAYQRLNDLLNVSKKLHNQPEWANIFINSGLTLIKNKPLFHNNTIHCGDLYKFKNLI